MTIHPSVGPLACRSVGRSVDRSVGRSVGLSVDLLSRSFSWPLGQSFGRSLYSLVACSGCVCVANRTDLRVGRFVRRRSLRRSGSLGGCRITLVEQRIHLSAVLLFRFVASRTSLCLLWSLHYIGIGRIFRKFPQPSLRPSALLLSPSIRRSVDLSVYRSVGRPSGRSASQSISRSAGRQTDWAVGRSIDIRRWQVPPMPTLPGTRTERRALAAVRPPSY